jgi:hypothetical protein
LAELKFPPVRRDHLDAMSNEIGVWQHAVGLAPNREFGFCTDDVARAMVVDRLHARELGWAPIAASAERSLRFLEDAFEPGSGRFRNFRDADGGWLDSGGSEDCHARAMAALASVAGEAGSRAVVERAGRLFARALPAARHLSTLRGVAAGILACNAALEVGMGDEATGVHRLLAARLVGAFDGVALASDWPWPEPVVTWENALLPQALIVGGRRIEDERMVGTGCAVLDWLVREQTNIAGVFSPIGNGWWQRGGERSVFDQQPIEAAATILAAEAAHSLTGAKRYEDAARTAYGWFLGENILGVPVADTATGGCFDAITPRGVNENQGAESTLMWLTALEHMRRWGSRLRSASI